MNKTKNVLIKIVLILAGIFLIVGCIGMMVTFSSYSVAANVEESESFPLDTGEVKELQIDARNTDIYLQATDETESRIEYYAKGRNVKNEEITSSTEGETQTIVIKEEAFPFFKMDFLYQSKSTLHIFVPANELEKIKAYTASGTIEGQDLEIPSLEVQSSNGRITLKDISGELKAKTKNGRVNIETESFENPMDLETRNGRITINSNQKPTNAMLDLHTRNGSINVFGSKDWDISYGDGENQIKARTRNGRITIE